MSYALQRLNGFYFAVFLLILVFRGLFRKDLKEVLMIDDELNIYFFRFAVENIICLLFRSFAQGKKTVIKMLGKYSHIFYAGQTQVPMKCKQFIHLRLFCFSGGGLHFLLLLVSIPLSKTDVCDCNFVRRVE